MAGDAPKIDLAPVRADLVLVVGPFHRIADVGTGLLNALRHLSWNVIIRARWAE